MAEIKPDLGQSLQLQALTQLSELSNQIGVVQGQNIIIIKEQERAAEGRRLMYDKVSRIDTLANTVERIVPLVDKHETKYNQTAGAWGLGKTLWAMGAGGFGAGATMLISWLTGKHP